jgi:hypothetical protein
MASGGGGVKAALHRDVPHPGHVISLLLAPERHGALGAHVIGRHRASARNDQSRPRRDMGGSVRCDILGTAAEQSRDR